MGKALWAITRLWRAIGRALESIVRPVFDDGHATLSRVGMARP